MTQEAFSQEYDDILSRGEAALQKIAATKDSSSFTETLEKKADVIRQRVSDELDILLNRVFDKNEATE